MPCILMTGFGGVSIWTLDFDDFNNGCHNGPFPLLTTVRKVFEGKSGAAVQDFAAPSPPVTTTISPEILEEATTEPWDDGSSGAASQ